LSGRDSARPFTGESFFLGCDHAGYEMKQKIKEYLLAAGNLVEDLQEDFRERIDFPPVAEKVGRAVASRPGAYGILVCGTGIGVSMAANKVPGVRAAVLYDELAAQYARRHNDANVLTFGSRTMEFEDVRLRLETFFSHEPEGGKYAERNQYMERMDIERQSNASGG